MMLTAERVLELLDYDLETGLFTWRVTRGSRARVGAVAGTINGFGYRMIMIDGVFYMAHRIAWLYTYGEWPKSDIDHKDTIRTNNFIDNLRLATRPQNAANAKLSKKNTSGYKGVSYNREKGKWAAYITCKNHRRHLGYFDSPEAAHKAYAIAAVEHFGEFARVYDAIPAQAK